MFKGKKGQALAADIGKKSKTFVPGENLPEKRLDGPSKEDVALIKVWILIASSNCSKPWWPFYPKFLPLLHISIVKSFFWLTSENQARKNGRVSGCLPENQKKFTEHEGQ